MVKVLSNCPKNFSSNEKMAKLSYVCGSLCVYLVLIFRIASVSSNKDYYLYDMGSQLHRTQSSINIDLLENGPPHGIYKRDLKPNGTAFQTSAPNVTEVPVQPSKSKSVKVPKLAAPVNLTKEIMKDILQKNLGVNGTGQRKNISLVPPENSTVTTSVKPYVITPFPPLIHNLTNITIDQTELHEVSIAKFDEADDPELNKTLLSHNITTTRYDYHLYYNSSFKTEESAGHFYWVDMNNVSDVKTNDHLSDSYRRAATVKLSFEFPFYGHLIRNVTIATGGFLYTGEYVHSWLAATQYIAPLMANFDTRISNDSFIKHVDNGTAFTVQWEKVALQDKPDVGEFTFQVTLRNTGDIIFVYKNLPSLENVLDDHHPVKIGLSDAYIMDSSIIFVRRKTIYEYHRVNFAKEDIRNWTVIYLTALPTCLGSKDCHTCLTTKLAFKCMWCPTVNKCSNGVDRHRQDWLSRGCETRQVSNETWCAHINDSDMFKRDDNSYIHDASTFDEPHTADIYRSPSVLNPQQMGVSGIIAIMFLLATVSGLAVWVFYAYRNPHTTSGQILIRYRPSQWKWRRGEARYTAATIHM